MVWLHFVKTNITLFSGIKSIVLNFTREKKTDKLPKSLILLMISGMIG